MIPYNYIVDLIIKFDQFYSPLIFHQYLFTIKLSIMASKTQQVTKAKQTSTATKKTAIRRKYRVRNNLRFFRPSTLQVAPKPKYVRSTSALKLPSKFDKFSVLVHPLNTEKANKLMTERNTLTFIVHRLANKVQIKKAFNDIHKVKPLSINTLVTTRG